MSKIIGAEPSLRESPRLREALSLWPVYEFRPLFGDAGRFDGILRYNDGQWTPDDGEYDLAFARRQIVLMVALPYQRNIIWSGTTGHWSGYDADHPRGNAWHYMKRTGAESWRGEWPRDSHPNSMAGKRGMNEMCGRYRSASGMHVEFKDRDPHIAAGLLRERETKLVVKPPERRVCVHCGPRWEDKAAALLGSRNDGSGTQKTEVQP